MPDLPLLSDPRAGTTLGSRHPNGPYITQGLLSIAAYYPVGRLAYSARRTIVLERARTRWPLVVGSGHPTLYDSLEVLLL